jgi:ribonuclease E
MAKEMLINVSEGEECRIALLEEGKLEELYMERTSSTSHVGNVYKGRVTNVEASIQAAFVDFGLGRNGFLHISDLMPTYFGRRGEEVQESVGRKMARRDRPPIQRCLRRGDEIVVQIIKEGIGTKGPTLSTYLSIPGRILVMMPGMVKMGVSKKIEDETERRRLRQILDSLDPPDGVGFIIRTAGVGKSKTDIQRDLTYLTRLWQTLQKKSESAAPLELYTEGDLVARTVRDVFSPEIDRIVIDNKDVARRVKDVIKLANPRTKNKVDLYEEPIPLFHKYEIEHQIELMYSRHVPLPSGGSLVIDSTEAVVTIDVNSGKNREHSDAEITAFRTDMEAADEIPRQLRLRDLGGVIIVDFIDLRAERHRRELEHTLHENFKNDRAKTKVLRMSQFGIVEMTRQRMRPSLKRSIYFDCPYCKGAGLVKTPESMSLDVMRRLAIAFNDLKVSRIELTIAPDVNFYLQNKKRGAIAALEAQYKKSVIVKADLHMALDEMRLVLFDSRDGLVFLDELAAVQAPPIPHTTQLGARPAPSPQPNAQRGGRGGARGGRGDRGGFDDRRQRSSPPSRLPPPRDREREPEPGEDRFDIEGVVDSVEDREETIERAAAEAGAPSPLVSSHTPDQSDFDEMGEAPQAIAEHEDDEVDVGESVEDDFPGPGNERNGAPIARDLGRRGGQGSLGGQGANASEGGPDDQPGGRRRRRRRGRRGRGGRNGAAADAQPNSPATPFAESAGNDGEPDEPFDEADELDRSPVPSERDRPESDVLETDSELVADADAEGAEDRAESNAGAPAESSESSDDAPRRRRRRRGGRGRRRRADAPGDAPVGDQNITVEHVDIEAEEAVETVAASKPAPPARAPSRRQPKLPAPLPTPIEVPDTVRTGSTDRHLMHDDEPVIDEPIRRPRSYRDLDQIPDDME